MLRKFGIVLLMVFMLPFIACEDSDDADNSLLPKNFMVEIPDAISYDAAGARIAEDDVNGGLIYALLGVYVKFGEASALLVQEFIVYLRTHPGLTKVDTFIFTSEQDGRVKTATIEEDATYEGTLYQYKVTVWDEIENTAFQLFWNNSPVSGIAIMNPYNIDRTNEFVDPELMYSIEYTEEDTVYDKVMIVSVTGNEPDYEDGIDNFKMYVGKTGNTVEIFGNSNHPSFTLIGNNNSTARNYAFVGRANAAQEIGVAQVAMPLSTVKTNVGLFEDYSIRKVLQEEVLLVFGSSLPAILEPFLLNSDPPGYFVKGKGFEGSAENLPDEGGFTESFIDLTGMKPYIPNDIQFLNVEFEED